MKDLGKCGIEGDTPVHEIKATLVGILSTVGHVKPAGIWEDHLPRLSTT